MVREKKIPLVPQKEKRARTLVFLAVALLFTVATSPPNISPSTS